MGGGEACRGTVKRWLSCQEEPATELKIEESRGGGGGAG